ncbi:RNA-binding with multiple splicing 2 [Gossypium arboreum]|uniref:RNA-binding with multiple splicing 2 n=1 Tax=Gossypium arboreum TaxID=29729 RepID=A0A0B0MVR7_GOSAR|nr:RNA-binding with multiple splicing 2 [Gossypium arboreum]KHG07012.1 RNA-binding with multiple splicing 2 [Gossypium arboreum]
MADNYWNRQQPTPPMLSSGGMLKRPRTDYDAPPSGLHPAHEMHHNLARDDDQGGHLAVKDTKTIGSAYDRYLQSAQLSSFTSGEASTFGGLGRAVGVAMPARPMADPPVMGRPASAAPDLALNGGNVSFGGQFPIDPMARLGRDILPLPPDASNTLFVEGLPPDSTRREVARILFNDALDIFRPFVGYKEVRLVSKEYKHLGNCHKCMLNAKPDALVMQRGGDPIILCFVDFSSPACAATAMSALQGYKIDEHDPDSNYLRLQFSRNPGPRSGSGVRGRR